MNRGSIVNSFCFNIISIQINQYNTVNVKLSNSQLNKLKSTIRNSTKATLNLSSIVICNSNNETNFLHNYY